MKRGHEAFEDVAKWDAAGTLYESDLIAAFGGWRRARLFTRGLDGWNATPSFVIEVSTITRGASL